MEWWREVNKARMGTPRHSAQRVVNTGELLPSPLSSSSSPVPAYFMMAGLAPSFGLSSSRAESGDTQVSGLRHWGGSWALFGAPIHFLIFLIGWNAIKAQIQGSPKGRKSPTKDWHWTLVIVGGNLRFRVRKSIITQINGVLVDQTQRLDSHQLLSYQPAVKETWPGGMPPFFSFLKMDDKATPLFGEVASFPRWVGESVVLQGHGHPSIWEMPG